MNIVLIILQQPSGYAIPHFYLSGIVNLTNQASNSLVIALASKKYSVPNMAHFSESNV